MTEHNRRVVKDSLVNMDIDMSVLSRIFYQRLVDINAPLESLFALDLTARERKFFNMLAVFKSAEQLERIEASIHSIGKRHCCEYGAKIEHLPFVRQALIEALSLHLNEQFDERLQIAWASVFDEISQLLVEAMKKVPQGEGASDDSSELPGVDDLLAQVGGYDGVLRVHTRFYERIFDDPWLGEFFLGKHESTLAKKQTRFMIAAFGGENLYKGETPAQAHMHMYITREQLEAREAILRWALVSEGVNDTLIEYWLSVDRRFWGSIEKASEDDCVMRCAGQVPIVVSKPSE